MTGSPYAHEWTDEQRERIEAHNLAASTRLELVDLLAVNEAHARRAKVRVAALFPPTVAPPSTEDVRTIVDDTAPKTAEELLP